jgi:hypothetical protein
LPYTFAVAFTEEESLKARRRETSMLTNRTNIKRATATATWQPSMGMPVTASASYCLRSLPTNPIVGGRVQRHGQNIESLGFSDRRQNQF